MKRRREKPPRTWLSFLKLGSSELALPAGGLALAAAAAVLMVLIMKPPAWMLAFPAALFAGAAFWGWMASYRKLRAVADIPLSRIGSAAQGYTRLEGRAVEFPGTPLRSPLRGEACCWYSYRMSTRDDQGETEESHQETTEWSFAMRDSTGECVVDPAGAKVISVRHRRHHDAHQTWSEKVILAGDPICVIGEFRTSGAAAVEENAIDFRVGQIITKWKEDMPALIARHDLNRDGNFSEREWELLRREARRQAEAEMRSKPPQAQHQIAKPRDGRAFLVSALTGAQLMRDLRIWVTLNLVFFAAGIAAVLWLLRYG